MNKLISRILIPCALALLAACQSSSGPESEQSQVVIVAVPEVPVVQPNRTRSEIERFESLETFEPSVSTEILHEDLWDRIIAGFRLQDHYFHPDVQREVNEYAKKQQYFDRIAHRATPFLYWMVEEIERRELPAELLLLPMIESAFDPRAASNQGAAGLWQFVAPTANMLGLQQDWWYDGRQDPLASTSAALDYLATLYDQFDQDWLLALAAYNAGEGNMRQALRRADTAIFWDLRLPGETQVHVPRLLALAQVIAQAENHEIQLPEIPNSPYFRVIDPGFQVDLSIAAETAGLELAVLRELNPGYLQWATHPDTQHRILVPLQIASGFETSLVNIPQDQRLIWDQYQIQTGDTLSSIARKLGTRVDVLQRANGLSGSRIIAGRSLIIPRTENPDLLQLPNLAATGNTGATSVPEKYQVRRGDNLWSIARKFDLYSRDIAQWNNISLDAVLRPGQLLLLRETVH